MAVFVIGPDEKATITEAVTKARANPIPWAPELHVKDPGFRLDLKQRPPGIETFLRPYPPQHVTLGTYKIAFSFEHQPLGLFRHLSISTSKGKIPGLEVVSAAVQVFGFSGWPLQRPSRIWNEEFEEGHYAVNVIELDEPS